MSAHLLETNAAFTDENQKQNIQEIYVTDLIEQPAKRRASEKVIRNPYN
jgi:hypothetical protein